MASPPPPDHDHLTLDLKTSTCTAAAETHKLEEFLSRLEEERTKIDAFKRELPLCMQLLTNAMESSREELENWRSRRAEEEELMPQGRRGEEKRASEVEKRCWMTSVQLWSGGEGGEKEEIFEPRLSLERSNDRTRGGGAFLPFTKDRGVVVTTTSTDHIPELGLCSSSSTKEKSVGGRIEEENGEGINMKCFENESRGMAVEPGKGGEVQNTSASGVCGGQSHRKARRCWSPELHRRFINALQLLGGSQVATPKQIRELMKVEGLTNDEVKSHLQKYRLHTRRPGGVPQGVGSGGPQLVVLGGIWVPPEYAAAAHGGAATIYSTHASPSTFCTPPVSHEFYPVTPMTHAAALARTHDHHQHYHRRNRQEEEEEEEEVDYRRRMYNGCREGGEGEQCEGDGGREMKRGSERKSIVNSRNVVMEEGDESNNVSEITLKV